MVFHYSYLSLYRTIYLGDILARKRRSRKKQNKLLFELGIAIILLLTAYIIMSTVTLSVKIPIVTTEELWKYADYIDIIIVYEKFNSTNGEDLGVRKSFMYHLKDIASYSDEYLYLSIPDPSESDVEIDYKFYYIGVELVRENKTIVWSDLIQQGLNYVEVYIDVINSTPIKPWLEDIFSPSFIKLYAFETNMDPDGKKFPVTIVDGKEYNNVTEFMNQIVDEKHYNTTIDLGELILFITSNNLASYNVGLEIYFPVDKINGFKLKINLYATSEKPVFKWITEPFATLWGALVGAFYSLWEKMKSVVVGAFSGASLGAVFTGLVENVYVAILLTTLIFLVIAYFAYEHKRGRRRRR
ncbi:MAG: hypothetical protein ACTSVA_01375 [Candidatus Njordarchaeales archaeon]